MDMAGISQQGLDVSHAFSLALHNEPIMKVNCTEENKTVQGFKGKTYTSQFHTL
jgi:hypothetical protein